MEKVKKENTTDSKLKNNRGITLLALIVTIIVLLILAGISISYLINQNGILNNATQAQRLTSLEEAKEQVELMALAYKTDYYDETYVKKNVPAESTVGDYVQHQFVTGTVVGNYILTNNNDRTITIRSRDNTLTGTGTILDNGSITWETAGNGDSPVELTTAQKLAMYFSNPQSEMYDPINDMPVPIDPIMDPENIEWVDNYYDSYGQIFKMFIVLRYHDELYVMSVEDSTTDPWEGVNVYKEDIHVESFGDKTILIIPDRQEGRFYERCLSAENTFYYGYVYTDFDYYTVANRVNAKTGYRTYEWNSGSHYYDSSEILDETGAELTDKTQSGGTDIIVTNDNIMHNSYVEHTLYDENHTDTIEMQDSDLKRYYDYDGNLIGTREYEMNNG